MRRGSFRHGRVRDADIQNGEVVTQYLAIQILPRPDILNSETWDSTARASAPRARISNAFRDGLWGNPSTSQCVLKMQGSKLEMATISSLTRVLRPPTAAPIPSQDRLTPYDPRTLPVTLQGTEAYTSHSTREQLNSIRPKHPVRGIVQMDIFRM